MFELDGTNIPPWVLAMIPECVAREKTIIPVSVRENSLVVCFGGPANAHLVDQLRFILNAEIRPVVASRESVLEAIDRHDPRT